MGHPAAAQRGVDRACDGAFLRGAGIAALRIDVDRLVGRTETGDARSIALTTPPIADQP